MQEVQKNVYTSRYRTGNWVHLDGNKTVRMRITNVAFPMEHDLDKPLYTVSWLNGHSGFEERFIWEERLELADDELQG